MNIKFYSKTNANLQSWKKILELSKRKIRENKEALISTFA